MDQKSIILFSQGTINHWMGLPKGLLINELIELFGNPLETTEGSLGYYPALRYNFIDVGNKAGFVAYVRQRFVVLIETKILPDAIVLNELSVPDAILPHEILVEGAYAAEYLYCERGLVLTVAKHFNNNIPDEIVRCRGFEKINSTHEFDSRYYKSFEDSRSW